MPETTKRPDPERYAGGGLPLLMRYPQLMQELARWDVPQDPTDDGTFTVRFYTQCGCAHGPVYWGERMFYQHACEVLLCGACGAWTLEVTY